VGSYYALGMRGNISGFRWLLGLTPFPPWSPLLWGRTDGPVPPASRSKASRGGVWVFPSRSPGLTWAVSTICARAGRCREGGLSSTDERVRGHVTEVTQALWKSSECPLLRPKCDVNTLRGLGLQCKLVLSHVHPVSVQCWGGGDSYNIRAS
jgi:hypothetical protein